MDDRRDFLGDVIAPCLLAIVVGIISGLASYDAGKRSVRKSATQAGAAEWRIDSQTGERSFEWIGGCDDGSP